MEEERARRVPAENTPPGARAVSGTRFLSARQVASMLGVSVATVWPWERDKQLPARRRLSTSRVAWLESEVREWIESRDPMR